VQHFDGMHLTGISGIITGGAIAAENTNKLTEPADSSINNKADFFMGITVVFFRVKRK